MAPRLKYSIALIAACVVTALLIQLSQPQLGGLSSAEYAGMVKRQQLFRRAMDAQRLHREYVLGDSLIARLPDSVGDVVAEQPAYAYEPAAALQTLVSGQLADISPVRARIGVFLHDVTAGKYPGSQVNAPYSGRMYFTGVDAKAPYCVSAISMAPEGSQRRVPTGLRYERYPSDVLGACAFWARYGAPGAGVEQWLRQGGYYFASSTRPGRPEARVQPYPPLPFGIRWDETGASHGYACRAGDEARCVDALRASDTIRQSHAAFSRRPTIEFGFDETALLAEVERQFGHERFARFWHSSEDLEPGFAQAFGVPAGAWVREWAQKHHGVKTRGPGLAGSSVVLTLFTALLLAGVSIAIAARREVQ